MWGGERSGKGREGGKGGEKGIEESCVDHNNRIERGRGKERERRGREKRYMNYVDLKTRVGWGEGVKGREGE